MTSEDVDRLRQEVAHWKANHDNQVAIKQAISQRPDLQDRATRVSGLIAEIEQLKRELYTERGLRKEFEALAKSLQAELDQHVS